MTLTVTITTDNAAFEHDLHGEVARILRTAARRIVTGNTYGKLFDSNGSSN